MTARPPSPPAAAGSLLAFRGLVLGGGLLLLAYWLLLRAVGSPAHTMTWAWVLMGAWTLGMVAASFVGTWTTRRIVLAAILHPSLTAVVGTWVNFRHDLDWVMALGLTTVVAASGLAMIIYARSRRSLAVMLGALTATLGATAAVAAGPTPIPAIYTFYVGGLAIGAYMAGSARLVVLDKLRLGRDRAAEQRRLLRTIIDTIPDYIFVKDRDGRAVLRNLANARGFGYDDPDALVGLTEHEAFPHSELAARYHADDMRVIETGEALVDVEEPTVIDGRPRWLLTTKTPLRDASGAIVGLVGTARDVTERRAERAELV